MRWWIAAGVLLAALLALCFAPQLGLERLPLVAAALPARNAWTVGLAVLGAGLLAWGAVRRGDVLLRFAAVLLAAALASSVVIVMHGTRPSASTSGGLRILSWNINGRLVSPEVVARLAAQERADVVVLPEIAPTANGAAYVPAMARAGLAMRELPSITDGDDETIVLARTALGRYRLSSDRSEQPDRSAVLDPATSGLPRIVAIHAIIPALRGTSLWSADLDWVARECASADVIAVGDFNTSIDGFGGPALGGCRDAATLVHAASVGSWPTALPVWLSMPIDHVLVGSAWTVRSFTVLTSEDGSGSRHRPVLAVVARR